MNSQSGYMPKFFVDIKVGEVNFRKTDILGIYISGNSNFWEFKFLANQFPNKRC